MLMMVMSYSFIFLIPSVLYQLGILFSGEIWGYILLISPAQSVSYLIEAGLSGIITTKTLLSLGYLVLLSLVGYYLYVYPKYKFYAVKQSGV